MNANVLPLFEQKSFRAIVVGCTGLTLAVMIGSLALVQGRDTTGFRFAWSWWSVVFSLLGLVFNWSLWRAVWRGQSASTPANKSKVVYHLFLLAVLGVGSFLYPIRFLEQEHYTAIARGLFTAVFFLGGVGVLLYKVGQGLFATDLKDGQSS